MQDKIQIDAIQESLRDFLRGAAMAPVLVALGAAMVPEAKAEMLLPRASAVVTPFKVDVPQADIDDLKARLARTRFPDNETVSDWSQGVPLAKARALIAYWRDHYDWRRFERKINALPQFRTEIDGLGVHFLHVRSKHPNALPMIMTHGWPGSFIEFLKVIDPLTDPTAYGGTADDAFHLVIPSQPGYGFSDKPTEKGWNIPRTADAWSTLMQRLGYDHWVAQGGDWGAAVTHFLAKKRPHGLAAAHVNWQFVYDDKPRANPTPPEKAALNDIASFATGDRSGYFRIEGTRPQTLGYGLADSPIGQAMWIYEKFYAWSDNRDTPEGVLGIDEMLDDISLYWFTNTAASSGRTYWENARDGADFNFGKIELPMAATVFPGEIWRAPETWAKEMWPNLYYWNEAKHGGHFAAFEQPAIFVEEMRKAFRAIRACPFTDGSKAGNFYRLVELVRSEARGTANCLRLHELKRRPSETATLPSSRWSTSANSALVLFY